MQDSIRLALLNIIRHGDTDIFPFPFENRAFFDNFDDTVALLYDYHRNFSDFLDRYPPHHVNSLTPAGYNGFRWATQLDPIWNAYFLACVLSIAEPIEAARIPKDQNIVFSYRYAPDPETGDFFDRDFTWANFISCSLELSNDFEYIVICDIAEFYPRVGHHRLENALRHVDSKTDIPFRIMTFLSHFTHTRSLGLPIGGPASRILSEITLNQVDRLLKNAGIVFVRYADDYHLFAKDRNQAYQQLIFLSENCLIIKDFHCRNQRLALLLRPNLLPPVQYSWTIRRQLKRSPRPKSRRYFPHDRFSGSLSLSIHIPRRQRRITAA